MSIIKEEYRDLPPKGEKLSDVVVLAQAWKKSHTFIRRHNWYADVLELDASTIDLEDYLVRWGAEVSQGEFRPKDLLLVPAPKNARWSFRQNPSIKSLGQLLELTFDDFESSGPSFDDWSPSEAVHTEATGVVSGQTQVVQKLRPLAHLSIRDQTLATAVMMCLAEVVESVQGDSTGTDVLAMRASGVVSYGNRLHCTWAVGADGRSRAQFSWGNSRTYRQYFQDSPYLWMPI